MSRTSRKRVENPSRLDGFSSPTQRAAFENSLLKIFSSLAHLLLRNGYGFGVVSSLAKAAFVDASRTIERRDSKSKRASIASIATATGLTRVEVARIGRSLKSTGVGVPEHQNRAIRVAQGWLSDRKFLQRNGRPKILRFTGGNGSFDGLVKKYSGDIPARAMLNEMKRLALVKHRGDDSVSLVRAKLQPTKATLSTLGAIAPWAKLLTAKFDSLGPVELDSSINRFSMHFESLPQAQAALREIEDRKEAFIDALTQLSTRARPRDTHSIEISIAIATTRPNHADFGSRRTRGIR
jgi:hypothetical protein